MAQVDGNSNLVHFLNGRDPRLAQPRIAWLETAVSEGAAVVVGDLHDAHAQITEHLNPIRIVLQKRRVLKTWKDADFVLPLGARNVRVFANDSDRLGIFLNQR